MLKLKNVSKIYGNGATKVVALDKISFHLEKGAFAAIMGPSGSGKSTLLNIIGGLDRLSEGEVLLDGRRIDNLNEDNLVSVRRGEVAYIFQQYYLIPSLTAIENVLLPLTFCGRIKSREQASDILQKVGLTTRANHKPSELSGGEQQRVAIARALINKPSLILADEPTGNMDKTTGKQILDLFDELNKEGNTIIMVTHDHQVAKKAKITILLEDGQIIDVVNKAG
ncbi:MAG: ABC transporter ATP-binding protein [Dehalococcoidia bacterium]|nr:MAG: ABC transporter ATP-binding protein [Dehalococcoidia bacterium]